jgi:TonB family protein
MSSPPFKLIDLLPKLRYAVVACLGVVLAGTISSQRMMGQIAKTGAPGADLIGRPLYLRGFWMRDKLNFDATGRLVGHSETGPLTLSGIKIRDVGMSGSSLVLHGSRVALIADDNSVFRRQVISSTTEIWPSFRKNLYVAEEEIVVKVEPNASGDFDAALHAIFTEKLADLTSSLPAFWRCYAEGHINSLPAGADAEKVVTKCLNVINEVAGVVSNPEANGRTSAPVLVSSQQPRMSGSGRGRVEGTVLIHMVLTEKGIPVGLQILRPLGMGLDEQAVAAVSRYQFKPAVRDGAPIPVEMKIDFRFSNQ